MTTVPVLTAVCTCVGNYYSSADPNLELGKKYIVRKVEVGNWNTNIFLEGVDEAFNSVQFKFFEGDEPVNIYYNPRYHSYSR